MSLAANWRCRCNRTSPSTCLRSCLFQNHLYLPRVSNGVLVLFFLSIIWCWFRIRRESWGSWGVVSRIPKWHHVIPMAIGVLSRKISYLMRSHIPYRFGLAFVSISHRKKVGVYSTDLGLFFRAPNDSMLKSLLTLLYWLFLWVDYDDFDIFG
jgi:hypothetical protein